jgi:hypothetical protein
MAAAPEPSPTTHATTSSAAAACVWIGVAGTAAIVLGQWAAALGCVPAWVNQEARGHAWFGGSLGGVLTAAILAAAAVLVQLPFDLLARTRPRPDAAPAPAPSLRSWWRRWWSGVWRWIAAAAMGGAVLGLAWEADADRWLAWSILGFGLLAGIAVTLPVRPGEAVAADPATDAWTAQVRQELVRLGLSLPRIRWFDHGERSLDGGWHGLGPWATLWLSRSLRDVPPPLAAGLVVREIGHADRGDRAFGVLASAAWIAAGLAVSWIMAGELLGEGPATPAGLVIVVAAVMSSWSLVGALLWPALGRRQVLAADRFMLRAGMSRDHAVAVLDELADRNGEARPASPPTAMKMTMMFRPIPPMDRRRRILRGDDLDLRTTDPRPETES